MVIALTPAFCATSEILNEIPCVYSHIVIVIVIYNILFYTYQEKKAKKFVAYLTYILTL